MFVVCIIPSLQVIAVHFLNLTPHVATGPNRSSSSQFCLLTHTQRTSCHTFRHTQPSCSHVYVFD
eukprot:m.378444 g.378444  ORF g.378444 m.378444 type:complete len:65 (-) comp94226_c0_seq1:6-200(-)